MATVRQSTQNALYHQEYIQPGQGPYIAKEVYSVYSTLLQNVRVSPVSSQRDSKRSLVYKIPCCTVLTVQCTGSFSQNSLGKFTSQGILLTLLVQKSQQPKKSTYSVGAWSAHQE
jgi:hypothetical protein